MFTKRIIPCLDVNNGRVVKGVNFVNLKDAGDPVEIAAAYDKAGADELVFLDITASSDHRKTVVDMVRKVAEKVFIPFTVGGGIRTVEDFRMLLREGADKISINSSAIDNPQLIHDAAQKFGRQCVVVAIDAKRRADGSGWNVYKHGGNAKTSLTYEDLRHERRMELAFEGQYWYDLVRRAYYKQQEVVNYVNNQNRNASYYDSSTHEYTRFHDCHS